MGRSKKDCGMCKNLDAPYYGKSCRERIKKKPDSKICTDFELRDLTFDEIQAGDAFIKKIIKRVEGGYYNTDETLITELNSYYIAATQKKGKEVRQIPLEYKKKSLVKLLSLFEEIQAYKDRVTRIQVNVSKQLKKIQALKDSAIAYLYKTYGTQFLVFKTDAIRKTVIDGVLEPLTKKMLEIEIVMNTATLVKENLNDTFFSLRVIKDLAEGLYKEKQSHN